MKKSSGRTIPQSIRREVRQRCGFGCVICGSPIYHYDHMKDWAKFKRHIASEITLLCPTHHQEKNSGLLSLNTIQKHNQSPHNNSKLFSPKWKINYEKEIHSVVGGMVFNSILPTDNITEEFFTTFLKVGAVPIIWFNIQDGNLLLNTTIYRHGTPIFVISDNELVYITKMWDVDFIGKTLTIREGYRKIVLKITFDVNGNKVVFNHGNLTILGREITIREDNVKVKTGNSSFQISGGSMTNVKVGIQC